MVQESKKKKSLLDDEGEDLDNSPANLGIRVNKQYAARFEHNKRREELHRLQAKYPEEAEKLARKMAREAALAAGEEPPEYGDEEADSEEDEEEDEGEIPSDTEAQIFDTLLRIRRKDPAIYQKDVAFFNRDQEEGEGDGEGEGVKKPKKEKPMYLKDLIAKQALEYGPELGSSDEEEGGRGRGKGGDRHPKAYDAEQEELRKAFLSAVDDAGEEEEQEALGGVLRVRSRAKGASGAGEEGKGQQGGEEGAGRQDKTGKKKKGKQQGGEDGDRFQQLINAYFGDEEQLNPDDKFLKEYIVNKGWVDKDDDSDDDGEEGLAGRRVPRYHQLVGEDEDGEGQGGEGDGRGVDDEEDERYLRQMDVFEAKYNFRFEEPGADRIVTHPRVIEGAVRKPDDRRKRSRESKKARQEAAEAEAREELKRLKNLKKGEIVEKLEKLRTVAGAAAPGVSALDEVLEGDFDPEAWDAKMAEAFGEEYYEAEDDLQLGEDEEHPGDMLEGISDISDSEEEAEDAGDEGAGGSRGVRSGSEEPSGAGASEDGEEEGAAAGGRKAVKFKVIKKKLQELDQLAASVEGDGTDAGEGKSKAKGGKGGSRPDAAALAAQRAELQRLLEDYYRLDYEDNVGGVKTRFRYKQVPASTFGLSVEELLSLDDKQLNAVVGMKRLAPYRDDAERMRPNYKALTAIKGELAAAKGGGKQRRQDWKRDRQHQHRGGPGGREWQQRRGPGGYGASGEGPKHGGAERRQDGREGGKGQGGEGADGGKKRKERAEDGAAAAGAPGGGEGQGTERGSKKARKEQNGGGRQEQQRSEEDRQEKEHGRRGQDRAHKKDKPHKKELDPEAARLASYAVPTLKKESDKAQYGGSGGQGGKKRKRGADGGSGDGGGGGAQAPPSDGPQLTRAQKKNLKRTQKRAVKRQGAAEGA